jgi:sporulation protein YlmC with PRC-barrel domain
MSTGLAHGHELISSEDVEGTNIHDAHGKKVGKVDHLMIERASGRVAYVVASGAGFLGLGHSHFKVPWDTLKYSTRLNGFEIGITHEQLKSNPLYHADR